MKAKSHPLLALTLLLWLSGCLAALRASAQQPSFSGVTPPKTTVAQTNLAKVELANRLVQNARKDYQDGNLDSAARLLQAASQIDPRNHEAWYLLDQVKKALPLAQSRGVYQATPYSGLLVVPRPVDASAVHVPTSTNHFAIRSVQPPQHLEPKK